MKLSDTTYNEIESMDVPPRYANSYQIHLGHTVCYTYADLIDRIYNLKIYPLCFDGNGIPIEKKVEKRYNITPEHENFYELCKSEVSENIQGITNEFQSKLDLGFHEEQFYRTDSDEYRLFTQKTFSNLYHKGVIIRTDEPNIWCKNCKTPLARAEVENKKVTENTLKINLEGNFIFVRIKDLKIGGLKAYIENAPAKELSFHYNGETYYIELWGENLPNFESNLANSQNSFRQLKLPFNTNPLDNVIECHVEEETRDVTIDHCWRCKKEVTIKGGKNWVLKTVEIKDKLIELEKQIEWFPESKRASLQEWIQNLKWDWTISRDRIYGTQIPFWQCQGCGGEYIPKEIDQYIQRGSSFQGKMGCCDNEKYNLTKQTLDTWLDSSLSPFFLQEKYQVPPETMIRLQSYDIIRTWAYYSLVQGVYFGKLPWKKIIITPFVKTGSGEDMHTSSGNAIFLDKILEKYTPFEIRYLCLNMNPGNTITFNENLLEYARKTRNKIKNIEKYLSFQTPKEGGLQGPKFQEFQERINSLDELLHISMKNMKFKPYISELFELVYYFSLEIIPEYQQGFNTLKNIKKWFQKLSDKISYLCA